MGATLGLVSRCSSSCRKDELHCCGPCASHAPCQHRVRSMTLQGWYSRWQTLTAPTISGKATRSPGVCAKPAAFKVTVCWACDGACLLAEVPEQVLRELGSCACPGCCAQRRAAGCSRRLPAAPARSGCSKCSSVRTISASSFSAVSVVACRPEDDACAASAPAARSWTQPMICIIAQVTPAMAVQLSRKIHRHQRQFPCMMLTTYTGARDC